LATSEEIEAGPEDGRKRRGPTYTEWIFIHPHHTLVVGTSCRGTLDAPICLDEAGFKPAVYEIPGIYLLGHP